MQVLNRHWSGEIDRRAVAEFGVSGLVLMENAGRGVVDRLEPRLLSQPAEPVVVCCGRGNNGGDGLVIARHLDLRGWPVEVLLFAEPAQLSPDAAANWAIVQRAGIQAAVLGKGFEMSGVAERLARASWIVDSLLGTGARGEPRAPAGEAIAAINAAGRPVVAVDLPSGLDCDAGFVSPRTIRAQLTCTFVALKPALVAPGAADFTGEIAVLDIGAPRRLLETIFAEAEAAAQAGAPQR
ncbi:MAG: NAD(P)H-hydrate epimerase [Pirellulales bacterium]|nr:NAD(P)H-hydrate epimerase [Pirellulales bacterium]